MKAVNLLPGDQRGSAKTPAAPATPAPGGSAFGAYVVLGALAFAVVATALFVLASNTVKDRETELARVTQEAQETQRQAAALQAFADFKTVADARVATVNGLAGVRFDWERSLRDLSRALPADVHLTALDGTTGTQSGGGSALRSAVQAPAISLSGCTKSQGSVARMMARLRNVRGVTRVTLAKSDKDGVAVTSTAPAAAGGTPARQCPKGQPPAFDVIVFFERSVVSPAAAPNTGAAPTTGAQPSAGTPTADGGATPAAGATTTTQGVSAK